MQDECLSYPQLKRLKEKLLHLSANDNDFSKELNADLQESFMCAVSSEAHQQKRLLAYETLTLCLHRLTRHIKKHPNCILNIQIKISNCFWEQLERVICDRWDGSDNIHQNSLIELIIKSLNFQDNVYQANRAELLLSRVSRMNFSLRIVHKVIEIVANRYGVSPIIQYFQNYVADAIKCINSRSLSATLARSLSGVLRGYLNVIYDVESWVDLWKGPLYKAIIHQCQQHRFNALQYIAPAIFKLSPDGFVAFIQYVSSQQPCHIQAVVGCLTVGKETTCYLDLDEETCQLFKLPESFPIDICRHYSNTVRTDALSLHLRHRQIMKAIPWRSFLAIKLSMDALTCETTAEQRNLLVGSFQAGIERLRSSTYNLSKEITKGQQRSKENHNEHLYLMDQLNESKKFCKVLVQYITAKISPTALYQQYHMSFRILRLLLMTNMDQRTIVKADGDQVHFPFHIDIWTTRLVRSLVEALLNGYNDIRSWASECLRKCPPDVFILLIDSRSSVNCQNKNHAIDLLKFRANQIMASGRQKEADGGARVIEMVAFMGKFAGTYECPSIDILNQLRNAIVQCRTERSKGIKQTPLHGYLITLKLLVHYLDISDLAANSGSISVPDLTVFTHSLFSISQDIWDLTKDLLCSDAPEGMQYSDLKLGFTTESSSDESSPSAQSVLSYSWRALSELSELWGAIFVKVMKNEAAFDWGVCEVTIISRMLQTWLMEARHRGAFSAVFPQFSALNLLCFVSKNEEIQGLPSKWLITCLDMLVSQSRTVTRRSGGLPFLIVAILSNEKDPLAPEFQKVMSRLVECAQTVEPRESYGIDLPKVHAINCIKAILTEAKLSGAKSADWLDDAINVSIISFSSSVWSVKNAALQLFTTVMNRILGTYRSRNQMIDRHSKLWTLQSVIDRYPTLEAVFQREFSSARQYLPASPFRLTADSVLFPLLSLLARLDVPTPASNPSALITSTIRQFLYAQLASPIWKMREMAAKSIPCLISSADAASEMVRFLETHHVSQNSLHGCLLVVESLFNTTFDKDFHLQISDLEVISQALDNKFDSYWVYNCCPITRESYFRLFLKVELILENFGIQSTLHHSLASFIQNGKSIGKSDFVHENVLLLTTVFDRVLDKEDSDIEWMPLMSSLTLRSQIEAIVHLHSLLQDHPIRRRMPDSLAAFLMESSKNGSLNANNLNAAKVWKIRGWPPLQQASYGILYQFFDICNNPTVNDLESFARTLEFEMISSKALSVRESALALIGPVLRHLLADGPDDCASLISNWLVHVRTNILDSSPVSSRVAALHGVMGLISRLSFNGFIGLLSSYNVIREQQTAVFMVLYDLLSDEAEEIRCDAAKVLATLQNQDWVMEPISCSWILLDMLCKEFGSEKEFQRILIDRLLGFGESLSVMIQSTTLTSDVLFEVEKQNLWRDDIRVYNQFLSHLSILTAESAIYVVTNVQAALDKSLIWLQEQGYDGPLGFTRDYEVYLNLYRVFSLATQLHSEDLSSQLESIKELGLKISLHEGLLACFL